MAICYGSTRQEGSPEILFISLMENGSNSGGKSLDMRCTFTEYLYVHMVGCVWLRKVWGWGVGRGSGHQMGV